MCSSARVLVLLLLLGCGKPKEGWPTPTTDARILEARRLLTEAGFPHGRGFPKLTLLYNTLELHQKIAVAVQEMWRAGLGLPIELRNVDWNNLMTSRDRADYDILRSGYSGEYSDPHSLLSLFLGDSTFNTAGWKSETYDKLVAESDLEPDPKKRLVTMGRAERVLLDELPMLPIYHYIGRHVVKPFVKNVHPNARDLHPLKAIRFEGAGVPADGTVIFNAGEEPQSLDPAISHDMQGLVVLLNLFEGLVGYDPVTSQPVPAAAERWDISDDGRVYTFHLREAKWSNGDPVTAGDFVYAWRRVVDPKTGSAYAHRMYDVEGGLEVAKGADLSKLAVRAIDDRTFEVTLRHRTPYFLQLACLNVFMPVHRTTVEAHKDWTTPDHMVCNGPYRLVERRLKDRKVFEKNAGYWDAANVKVKRAVFLTVVDSDAAFRMYEAGQVHWLYTIPTTYAEEIAKRTDTFAGPMNRAYFYLFNVKRKPLDDARVRRALSLCVDRESIVKHILRSGEPAAYRLTPPLYPGYEVP